MDKVTALWTQLGLTEVDMRLMKAGIESLGAQTGTLPDLEDGVALSERWRALIIVALESMFAAVTELPPLLRIASPEEIAAVLAHLKSEEA